MGSASDGHSLKEFLRASLSKLRSLDSKIWEANGDSPLESFHKRSLEEPFNELDAQWTPNSK